MAQEKREWYRMTEAERRFAEKINYLYFLKETLRAGSV